MASPPQGMCELLRVFINFDSEATKAAEKKLGDALKADPNQVVAELIAVLAASGDGGAPVELRQEAVVLLRQCSMAGSPKNVWSELNAGTRQSLKNQLLASIQQDSSKPVKRSVGNAATTLAETIAEDFNELMSEWPELMPALANIIGQAADEAQVTVCLSALKDLGGLIGEEMLKGAQAVTMLKACLTASSAEVRAEAAKLVFKLVELLEEEPAKPLGPLMADVINAIKILAEGSHEEALTEVLEMLIQAGDEEPEFFKENGLQQLWPLLIDMSKSQHWANAEVRHSAMEACMSFAEGLCEDFCKPEGLPFLEQLVVLNIEWMLEVEDNTDSWMAKAETPEEDYELDADEVEIGEENLDRLAEACCEKDQLEDVFMPLIFKVVRAALSAANADWKHARSSVMTISQVVEYIVENEWIDQCVTFLLPFLSNAHPRVRYSAFQALGQVAYDHDEYVQDNHHEAIMPAILAGLDDSNIRVATNAASAFASFGDDLDEDALEPHMEELMTKLFTQLQEGKTKKMQETCLSAIAVVGEAAEELFTPYYGHAMPVLKQIIANGKTEELKTLRGKAFECASLIGAAVGKETFARDAVEIMSIMMVYFQAGFAPDDQTREYVHEAAGRIASILEKDFKPFVPSMLPNIFAVLNQKPQDIDPLNPPDEEDEEDEMKAAEVEGKLVGLKTSQLDEMCETLSLISTLIEALSDDFVEFLQPTCTTLLPLLDFPLSNDVQEKAFGTWEQVVDCVRAASENGKCDKAIVVQLVAEFLKATVLMMAKLPTDVKDQTDLSLAQLKAQASAVGDVIKKAGKGVLGKSDVVDLVKVLLELLNRLTVAEKETAEAVPNSKQKSKVNDDSDDEDDDDDDGVVSRQSVRFSLVDVAGALMRMSQAEYLEVGLPTFMELLKGLLQPESPDVSKCLALYIADDVVQCLDEKSVPFWNIFMEIACKSITDKCPAVRQYATALVGHGAKQPIFAQIAPLAASQIARVLQKHGERHRRRRAANAEAKQIAGSVDAAIAALGLICEYQERNMGGDSTEAWKLWLQNMPPRYDRFIGQEATHQLLELVVKGHNIVTAPEQLPRVLEIFADVYKSRFSNSVLDKEIAAAVARAGAGTVQNFVVNFPERQQKKVEMMLKDGGKASD